MYRFFLFLRGYYLISVKGILTERFINLCKVNNIYLWDLKNSHNVYGMKISANDYNMLGEIINKTVCRKKSTIAVKKINALVLIS